MDPFEFSRLSSEELYDKGLRGGLEKGILSLGRAFGNFMCHLGWLLSHGVWDSIRFWLQIILSKQEFILMDLCFMCKGHGESMARLPTTICNGSNIMVISSLIVWCSLGNAFFWVGFVIFWQKKQWGDLESRSFVCNAVPLEREMPNVLRGKKYTW